MPPSELDELAETLRRAHPEWSLDLPRSGRRWLSDLTGLKWRILFAGVLVAGFAWHIGSLLFRGALIGYLLISPPAELDPDRSYEHARFILTLLPNESLSLLMGAEASLYLDRIGDTQVMAQRLKDLTGGHGFTGTYASELLNELRREREAIKRWEQKHPELTGTKREAARHLFIADHILSQTRPRLDRGRILRARRLLKLASKLDPRVAQKVMKQQERSKTMLQER